MEVGEAAVEARVGRGVQALETSSRVSPSARRKGMSTKTGREIKSFYPIDNSNQLLTYLVALNCN